MPLWCVRFPSPVVYNQGHIKGQQTLTEMVVSAPTAQGALVHAIRTVSGDVGEPTVEPHDKTPRPAIVETHPPHEGPIYVGG